MLKHGSARPTWHGREGVRRGKMSVRGETGWEGWMSMIKANE